MKLKVTLPLLLIGFSFNAMATNSQHTVQQQQMIDFTINQMKASGDFVEMAALSNIDALKIELSYRNSISTCFSDKSLMKSQDEEKMSQCFINELASNLDVTKEQMEIWATEESESMTPMEALDAEMDSLNEQIAALEDKPTLTSNEEAKLAQLEDTLAELSDKYQQLQAAEVNVLMSDSAPLINKN